MHFWTESGFGYPIINSNNKSEILEFISEHWKDYDASFDQDEFDALIQRGELDEIEEYIDEPVSWLIADVINDTEGLTVFNGFSASEETGEYLGIDPCYSWTMTEADKVLTKQRATELLKKYGEMLGVLDEPLYFEIEYIG